MQLACETIKIGTLEALEKERDRHGGEKDLVADRGRLARGEQCASVIDVRLGNNSNVEDAVGELFANGGIGVFGRGRGEGANEALLGERVLGHDVLRQLNVGLRQSERQSAEESDDAGGDANVTGDVIGVDVFDTERLEEQVEKRGVNVLGGALDVGDGGGLRVLQLTHAFVNESREPTLCKRGMSNRFSQRVNNGILSRVNRGSGSKCLIDTLLPPCQSHKTEFRFTDCTLDKRSFDIEGANRNCT